MAFETLNTSELLNTVTVDQDAPADGFDLEVRLPEAFRLDSGERLSQTTVIGRVYGPKDAPLVIAAGGISSGRFLYAPEDSVTPPGWWLGVAGPGAALDLNRWRVLTLEFSPLLPGVGSGVDLTAPVTITTQDQARLVHFLVEALGAKSIYALIGCSYGAMIGLAYASLYPDTVERLCVISAAHKTHPMATAMRGIQRRLLQLGEKTGEIRAAISLARELAMTTYRSDAEFAQRFPTKFPDRAGELYPVCEYLTARGGAYTPCPHRWISLSDSIDRHLVDPKRIKARVTLAAVPEDRLVPYGDMLELAQALGPRARLLPLPSLQGHDAFLTEPEAVAQIVKIALEAEPFKDIANDRHA